MSGQNEDQTSRRKFLKGAGLVGAATVATPAAANTVPSQSEWSPEQISKLEEIVKNFITNAQASNIQPLDSCARLMGHGSHNNEGSRARAAPATRTGAGYFGLPGGCYRCHASETGRALGSVARPSAPVLRSRSRTRTALLYWPSSPGQRSRCHTRNATRRAFCSRRPSGCYEPRIFRGYSRHCSGSGAG